MTPNNITNNTVILGIYAHIAPQTIIFLFGFLFTILGSCWVYCIIQSVRKTFKELALLASEDSKGKKIRTIKSKQSKHIFFLCFILLFIAHICARSVVYLTFALIESIGKEPTCLQNVPATITNELKFISSVQKYVFPMLAVSGNFFIATLISLGTFLLYVKETYNYFGKNMKWIKRWIFIGVAQVIISAILQLIPWLIVFGSVVLVSFLLVDYVFLIAALIKLVKVLNLKKIDAAYKSDLKFRYKQCLKGIRRLSRPLFITLFVYIFGIAMEQVAVWNTLARCLMIKYYDLDPETYVDSLILANIATYSWLITYITIAQFYISFLFIALAYFFHSRSNKKKMENEKRRLVSGFGDQQNGYYGAGSETEA